MISKIYTRGILTIVLAFSMAGWAVAEQEEYVYIVSEYEYEQTGSKENADTGQAICGTRCNAMSSDYKNYLYPGGWRLKRVKSNQELVIDLNNPFLQGKCTCVADKYLLKAQDLYMSKVKRK